MIYVQIACYRDPELLPTISDCLAKARFRNDLTFGICWQKADGDNCLSSFKDDVRFRVDSVPWYESQGPSWARSRIQDMYEGEEFTLQIDSHHRFVENWDVELLKCLNCVDSRKPIITTYGTAYSPESSALNPTPSMVGVGGFSQAGVLTLLPKFIRNWKSRERPIRARFVSAHLLFTHGNYCTDFRHDPRNYYAGEELAMSIRCFTMGYDFFHPHRPILWHNYTRKGRSMHWADHQPKTASQVDVAWHARLALSKKRLSKLVRQEDNDEDLTGFDLGDIRTHHDYELFAGIDFCGRRIHCETLNDLEPPCTYTSDHQWEEALTREYKLILRWDPQILLQCEDIQFIYLGVEDNQGTVLYRHDARPDSDEAKRLVSEKSVVFRSIRKPAKFVICPVSRSRGWMTKAEYHL